MHSSVSRVIDAARHAGLEISVESFPEGTRTAVEAATAISIRPDDLIRASGGLVGDLAASR